MLNLVKRTFKKFQKLGSDKNPNLTPIVMHHTGPATSLYQAKMWISTLEKLGPNISIVVREKSHLTLKDYTTIPVYFIPDGQDLSNLCIRKHVKVILYTANIGKNIHIVRNIGIKHVFLGHGDSEKSASAHNVFKMYDHAFVAGDAHIERFKRNGIKLPDEYFIKIGRPSINSINEVSPKESVKRNTVLYTPTWEGAHLDSHYSSIYKSQEIIDTLLNLGLDVIFRPHPLTGINDKKAKIILDEIRRKYASNVKINIDNSTNIYTQMNNSKFLISDISSVISDYLYFNKPIFLYINDENTRSSSVTKYCTLLDENNISDLGIMYDKDLKKKERRLARDFVLGKEPESSCKTLIEALERLSNIKTQKYE